METDLSDRLVLQHELATGQRWDFGSKRTRVQFVAIGSSFVECSFANFTSRAVSFASGPERSTYHRCEFKNVHFPHVLYGNFELVECSFTDCTFGEFFSDSADIVDCTFDGRIAKGFISARSTRGDSERINVIRGNDFSRVELFDFSFRGGVNLAEQSLPSGSDYATFLNSADAIATLLTEVTGWEETDRRKRLLPWLQGWMMDLEDGQRDLFVSLRKRANQRLDSVVDLVGLLRGIQQPDSSA